MKFHRLLAGTAVAALVAGNAFALDVTLRGTSAYTPGGGPAGTTLNLIDAPVFVAEETDGTDVALAGTVALLVTTNNDITSANNFYVTVDVVGGLIATEVDALDLIGQTEDGTLTTTWDGRNINFGRPRNTVGTDRSGEEGDSFVTFLASSAAGGGGTTFSVVLDVTADCSSGDDLNFIVKLETEAGNIVEQGIVSLADPAAECVNAYQATLVTDETTAGFDSEIIPSMFTAFDDSVGSNQGNDTDVEANVGDVSVEFDPDNPGIIFRDIFPTLLAAENETTGALQGVDAEVDEVSLTVSVNTSVGVEGIGVRVDGGATTPLNASNSATFTGPGEVGDDIFGVEVEVDGTTTLSPIFPVATAGTISFANDASDLEDEAVALPNSGVLDKLEYAGATCGTFDWVGDDSLTRTNVFRVTGFANAPTDGVFATISEASGTPTGDVTQLLTSYMLSANGNELSFDAGALSEKFGQFGRANFDFTFVGAEADVLDCDRLQASPVNSIVTGFGNGTGNVPYNDGDD